MENNEKKEALTADELLGWPVYGREVIINKMQEYADQQSSALQEENKKLREERDEFRIIAQKRFHEIQSLKNK